MLGEYFEHPDGFYTGNPGKSPRLTNLINSLIHGQDLDGSHLTTRDFQPTHNDICALFMKHFGTQTEKEIYANQLFDFNDCYILYHCTPIFFSISGRGNASTAH